MEPFDLINPILPLNWGAIDQESDATPAEDNTESRPLSAADSVESDDFFPPRDTGSNTNNIQLVRPLQPFLDTLTGASPTETFVNTLNVVNGPRKRLAKPNTSSGTSSNKRKRFVPKKVDVDTYLRSPETVQTSAPHTPPPGLSPAVHETKKRRRTTHPPTPKAPTPQTPQPQPQVDPTLASIMPFFPFAPVLPSFVEFLRNKAFLIDNINLILFFINAQLPIQPIHYRFGLRVYVHGNPAQSYNLS